LTSAIPGAEKLEKNVTPAATRRSRRSRTQGDASAERRGRSPAHDDPVDAGKVQARQRVKDVDVAFFDPQDLRPERDQAVEDELSRLLPEVHWDAKNQAAVHLWYERRFGVPS
jgi:hypothetical protein